MPAAAAAAVPCDSRKHDFYITAKQRGHPAQSNLFNFLCATFHHFLVNIGTLIKDTLAARRASNSIIDRRQYVRTFHSFIHTHAPRTHGILFTAVYNIAVATVSTGYYIPNPTSTSFSTSTNIHVYVHKHIDNTIK